ncbi:MAG: excinuclease ABC subunit UvrC [Lachnospiraceae bacterium]|nr:excinuclease ABC subunit UvrC [Lachnospiraceae bacterium]
MFDIEEELKKLPHTPGVYIMHDASDAIIYVGKAIDLFNRVHSYFRVGYKKSPKIEKMVTQIKRFEYIITDSELEALVLENNLIKEHEPKYNTMLKDDKTYPYIMVTLGEKFPRVKSSRTMKKDKSRYFGPFTSNYAVKETLDLLNKAYKIRTCNKKLTGEPEGRPCLNYHIGQCMAPCTGKVSEEEYRENIDKVLDFLGGNYSSIVKDLEAKMNAASEALDFETAATYRDLINSVKAVTQKQKITDHDGDDKDVIAIARDRQDNEAVVQVFFVRDGKLIGREHFYMTHVSSTETDADVLGDFVKQFYAGTPYIPKEIMLPTELEEAGLIEEWLTGRKESRVYIKVPKIGSKEKLVELARKNAALVLNQDRERLKREEGRTIGAVKEIQELLGLDKLNRMEAFDISNTSGFENVGSMVVFEKGKPKRSDYRKFKIKTVAGPDDYACMHEVLTRRLLRGKEESGEEISTGFSTLPDLILMDGGRGQVNICLKVLDELKMNIPVCGMVKDDFHRTRGIYFNNKELPIDTHSEGFKLVTRIQDEAHRFAIEFHRSLRSKDQTKSVLDEISGIGPARRKALMRTFASIEDVRNATLEELEAIPEMNPKAAESVYGYFHKQ